MRKHTPAIVVAALAVIVVFAGILAPALADARRFRAFVYPDRTKPDFAVVVDDFRVNESVWDEGGVQYIWVRGPAGNHQLPFTRIRQIEFQRYLGPDFQRSDWAWFDVFITGVGDNERYTGRIEIRVMRGIATGWVPWYYYPMTERDRGTKLWRIVFGDESVPPTIPWEAPKPAEAPIPLVVPQPVPPPALPTEEELFARLSLAELNMQAPLADVYFDFDGSTLRPDGEQAMRQNAAWLKRWPSVKARIEGYADPRGTNEYNLGLGARRAETLRALLAAQGVDGGRIETVSLGAQNLVCSEQTEACWARNRRAHFVITAK